MSAADLTTQLYEGGTTRTIGGVMERQFQFSMESTIDPNISQRSRKNSNQSNTKSKTIRARKRPSLSQNCDEDQPMKRSISVNEAEDQRANTTAELPEAGSVCPHGIAAQNFETSARLQHFIADVFLVPVSNSMPPFSNASKESGRKDVVEEAITEVTVSHEEATANSFMGLVKNQSNQYAWNVASVSENEEVRASYDTTNNVMHVWKLLNNDHFVFGFGAISDPYYVRIPQSGTGRLVLQTNPVSPDSIADVTADPRVMVIVPDPNSGAHNLQPASRTDLLIGIDDGHAAAISGSPRNGASWKIVAA